MTTALVGQFRTLVLPPQTPEDRQAVEKFFGRLLNYYAEFQVMKVNVDFWRHLRAGEQDAFIAHLKTLYEKNEPFPRERLLPFVRDLLLVSVTDQRYRLLVLLQEIFRDEELPRALQVVKYLPALWRLLEGTLHENLWDLVTIGLDRKDPLVAEEVIFEVLELREEFSDKDLRWYGQLLLEQVKKKRPWRVAALKALNQLFETGVIAPDTQPFVRNLRELLAKQDFKRQPARVYALLIQEHFYLALTPEEQERFYTQVAKVVRKPRDQPVLLDLFSLVASTWTATIPAVRAEFVEKTWKALARMVVKRRKGKVRPDVLDALDRMFEVVWEDFARDHADAFYE